jgi:hypothetical protein
MPRLPMPPGADDEAYRKNTKEQYEALGRFVEAFEAMVNEVREICIESICHSVGSGEREHLVEISFHHQSMTAKPLFDIMRAIIAEIVSLEDNPNYNDREVFRDVLRHIEKEYSELYWKRNDLLHGTWLIGYVSNDDPNASRFDIRRYKTTADGLTRTMQLPRNAEELLALASRCDEARTWIGTVGFCLQDRLSINEFFRKENKEWKLFLTEGSPGTTLPK